ncbi:AAA family ATPase [Mobiluncus mulieris]|uniref:AAA family ATPase n=1 Tax=Mobiluncus mulieris TaxID=2052 RepID=A0A7Y0U1M0_9ACTO|nr:ATP-binding protein [Mobiluncus mulieris]NMW65294.1 AAA family ATPase [Mobiluncus mulieris]
MRETFDLEFKSEISNSFLKTVSAYANFHGGQILFGVADDGTIAGLEGDISQSCLAIENKINDNIAPCPNFSLEPDEAKRTIRLLVHSGLDTPYLYRGKAYRRSDSATVEVDRVELNRLVLLGSGSSFEELPFHEGQLSFEALFRDLCRVLGLDNPDDDVLRTLGLLTPRGFNRAAALLADVNPFPGIDIVRFGASVNEILGRTTVEGVSILAQFDAAMDCFSQFLRMETITGATRSIKELAPHEAFREAVANALIHRTWDVNARVRISIFPDRVEVSSPGGLPAGLSEAEYLAGRVSVLRNPLLSEVFFRLGYIEKFGTGVLRIRGAYRDQVEVPGFKVMENSITVILPFIGSKSGINSDEARLLELMSPGRKYARTELEGLAGFEKSKTIRLLNALTEKSLVTTSGRGRASRYQRA